MKKIILDFTVPKAPSLVQEYLMDKFEFPPYYGKNLDALYDCLTEISEPVAVEFHMPAPDLKNNGSEEATYILKVYNVFEEAEKSNPNLSVILCK